MSGLPRLGQFLANWTREHPPATCSKCGKTVKPGRLLGYEGKLPYCYHCATARFYELWRERMNKWARKE